MPDSPIAMRRALRLAGELDWPRLIGIERRARHAVQGASMHSHSRRRLLQGGLAVAGLSLLCGLGPKARFTPESRHLQCTRLCPLWANSGHQAVPQKLNLPDLRIFMSNLLLAQCDQQSPSLIYVLDKRDRCMWRRQRSLNERSRASGDGDGDNNDTSVARYANMAWRTFNRRRGIDYSCSRARLNAAIARGPTDGKDGPQACSAISEMGGALCCAQIQGHKPRGGARFQACRQSAQARL